MDLLEPEARVRRVAAEQLIGEARLGLHLRRQGGERLAKPPRRV